MTTVGFTADDLHERKAEAVDGVMFCIAILDGARTLGLDISREERVLERLLSTIEAL